MPYRINLLAIMLIALTLLLGSMPAQAQVEPLPAAGARYDAPSSVVAGKTFDATLVVWSLNQAQFSAPAASSVCVKDNDVLQNEQTGLKGLNTGEANATPFARTTTIYVPPALAGYSCTVTSVVSFGGDANFTAEFAFSVLLVAFGAVHSTNESNEVPTSSNHKFAIVLTSNVGDVSFGQVLAHLDCGPGFEDDYVVEGLAEPDNVAVLYFYAGMPAVLESVHCTWTGTFVVNGESLSLTDTMFSVVPYNLAMPFLGR